MDKPLAAKVRDLITYICNTRDFQLIEAPVCPYKIASDVVLPGLNYQHVVAPEGRC